MQQRFTAAAAVATGSWIVGVGLMAWATMLGGPEHADRWALMFAAAGITATMWYVHQGTRRVIVEAMSFQIRMHTASTKPQPGLTRIK